MKKWTVILGLAMLLCVALAAPTMAAPTVTVSAKYMYLAPYHSPQLELGFPITDNFTAMLQGGPLVMAPAGVVLGGLRYYLTPDGLRPFGTLYGGVLINPGPIMVVGAGTVGLEYLDASGFRIAGELGVWYFSGMFLFTGGTAIGWAF